MTFHTAQGLGTGASVRHIASTPALSGIIRPAWPERSSALPASPCRDAPDRLAVSVNFDAYNLDAAIYDEMFLSDGTPREHCRALHDALRKLSDDELRSIQERVTRSFSNEGITFTVYGDDEADERIIPIDCVPRVLSGAEWRHLEAGLTQRIGALNRFLDDVSTERPGSSPTA